MRVLKLESSDEWLCLLESVKGLSHGSSTFYVMKKKLEDQKTQYTAIGLELSFSCVTEADSKEFERHFATFMVLKGEGSLH